MNYYYKSESEFMDTLDFLSPPLKRTSSRELFGGTYNAEPHNIRLLRGFRKNVASKVIGVGPTEHEQVKKTKRDKRSNNNGGSSTSLVLKRTTERKILNRYTVLSYTSLHTQHIGEPSKTHNSAESKNKPLIKVTVIPKNDHIQTAKLLTKRRSVLQRVQSTASNQENSIRTNNLYVVVAGRRNKIYEIKTTGSATLSSEQADRTSYYSKHDISKEQIANVKNLIESLDMDQKPKKGRYGNKIDDVGRANVANKRHEPSGYSNKDIILNENKEYTDLESENQPNNRSRVRIYGQLGLTGDDRYVLRYGATVNDKPVTDFAQLTQDFLPQVLPPSAHSEYDINPEVTREASVQANHPGYYQNEQPTTSGIANRRESQGTQVNFTLSKTFKKLTKPLKVDKDVQCHCKKDLENTTVQKCEINNDDQSPLVIISVYPKQSPHDVLKYDAEANKPSQTRKEDHVQLVAPHLKADRITGRKAIGPNIEENKTKRSSPRKVNRSPLHSRSPSPSKKISKGKLTDRDNETTVIKPHTSPVPDKLKTTRVVRNRTLEKERHKPEILARSKIEERTKPAVPTRSKIGSLPLKPVQRSRSPVKRISTKVSEEKGTNTDHARAKKDLVDNYTKQLNYGMSYRDMIPANSKITINIEGEQERCNVYLDQSRLSADVRVNKILKTKNLNDSLKNLLVNPEKGPDAKPFSVSLSNKPPDEDTTRISGMSIRDSLEISHRRDDTQVGRSIRARKTAPEHCIDESSPSVEVIAPIKHYVGDDCSISNPVERDQQIRELLGLNKSKIFSQRNLQAQTKNETKNEYPLHCFYRRKCEVSKVTEINMVKYCPVIGSVLKLWSKSPKTLCPNPFCDEQSCCRCNNNGAPCATKYTSIKNPPCVLPVQCENCPTKENKTLSGVNTPCGKDQQLILNRNVQIFLQVEQFSKQKPIILTRQQYDKVKRIIQNTITKKCICKEKLKQRQAKACSDITFGEVRPKTDHNVQLHFDQEIQTDWIWSHMPSNRSKFMSKVKYQTRSPRSKQCEDKFEDEHIEIICENLKNELANYYPQKERIENVEMSQPIGSRTNQSPQNYKYSRHMDEFVEVNQRQRDPGEYMEVKQRTSNYDGSNDPTNFKKIDECNSPRCMTDKSKYFEHELIHDRNETNKTHIEEYCKQSDKYSNREQVNLLYVNNTLLHGNPRDTVDKTYVNNVSRHKTYDYYILEKDELKRSYKLTKEQDESKSGEHKIFLNKYNHDNKHYGKHESKTKESGEYAKSTPKYCGKLYRADKESCKYDKEPQNSNYDEDFIITERNHQNEEYHKKNKEHSGLLNKPEENKKLYSTEHRILDKVDHAVNDVYCKKNELYDINTQKKIQTNANREYNVHGEVALLVDYQHPSNEEIPDTKKTINRSYQNNEGYNTNNVEAYPTIKQGYYRSSNEEGKREKERKPFNKYTLPLSAYVEPKQQRAGKVIAQDNNIEVNISRPKLNEYHKRHKESEQELFQTYSRLDGPFRKHKHKAQGVDYVGESIEYSRVDAKHPACYEGNAKFEPSTKNNGTNRELQEEEHIKTLNYYDIDRERKYDRGLQPLRRNPSKNTLSSLHIQYTSVSYLQNVNFSGSDIAVVSDSNACHVNSLQTIFRGHRKSATPNLGTSIYSMCSEDDIQSNKSTKFIMAPRDEKPSKKPFLRRLMSCLVMRSTRDSELKLPLPPAQDLRSVNSSIDSYHISTSLGAIEMSSSIYDTSVSFYSNHTILPINSKIKRGFFNSVRGFLMNRRS